MNGSVILTNEFYFVVVISCWFLFVKAAGTLPCNMCVRYYIYPCLYVLILGHFFFFLLSAGLSDSADVSVVIYILLVLNFCASCCRNWEIKWWN